MRDFEPLDLLIASMIAETGEPDEQAAAWVDQAMAAASRARSAGRYRSRWARGGQPVLGPRVVPR